MGMFDGILGGIVGAEMATAVNHLIEQHGGIGGIVSELQQKGLGETVKSWVGTGPNRPVGAEQLHQALGAGAIAQLAAKMGVNPQDLLSKLAQALPTAIDSLTPGGVVPKP
ncbi:MAG: DUF937 domain-containing protein [Gammaproteobacteria bacterium]|nr:DUF937 domain-containing protein [Gammaproteobacteria bacterium]MDE2252323.1 DUF937 domain-containing protein [Gammaproteobacteria bacterium]